MSDEKEVVGEESTTGEPTNETPAEADVASEGSSLLE